MQRQYGGVEQNTKETSQPGVINAAAIESAPAGEESGNLENLPPMPVLITPLCPLIESDHAEQCRQRERAEQNDVCEIAIRCQMGKRPKGECPKERVPGDCCNAWPGGI